MAADEGRKPNPEIPASELWTQIASDKRPFRVVDFPRKSADTGKSIGQVAIRVLTQAEQMVCIKAADDYVKLHKMEKPQRGEHSQAYDDMYKNASAVELLVRACRDVRNPEHPAFPTSAELRQHCTADELAVLVRLYFQVQTDLGPVVAFLTEEEIDAWVTRLAEGGDAFPLALLSSDEHDRLTLRLASRLHKSRTGNSSSGGPLSGGASKTESLSEAETAPAAEADPDEFAKG